MEKKCCICGKIFIENANNAEPVRKGICCDSCNSRYIIHTRLLASKIKSSISFEVVKNGQDFLDLTKNYITGISNIFSKIKMVILRFSEIL